MGDSPLFTYALGEPKTHMEARKIIAEVDSTGSGTINFGDFLRCIACESGDSPIQLFGRIANSGLAKQATYEYFLKNIKINILVFFKCAGL